MVVVARGRGLKQIAEIFKLAFFFCVDFLCGLSWSVPNWEKDEYFIKLYHTMNRFYVPDPDHGFAQVMKCLTN